MSACPSFPRSGARSCVAARPSLNNNRSFVHWAVVNLDNAPNKMPTPASEPAKSGNTLLCPHTSHKQRNHRPKITRVMNAHCLRCPGQALLWGFAASVDILLVPHDETLQARAYLTDQGACSDVLVRLQVR